MGLKQPSEHQEAVALVHWMRLMGMTFAHIPNYRDLQSSKAGKDGKRRMNFARFADLKAEGFAPGLSDYLIFSPPRQGFSKWAKLLVNNVQGPRGVALELKKNDGKEPTEAQLSWLADLDEAGWAATWKRGNVESIAWLTRLGYGVR